MAHRLEDLQLFRMIAQTGSLTQAGRHFGLSPATVSGRLKAIEDFYGVALVRRTTRSLGLTEEGQYLLDGSHLILEQIETLDSGLKAGRKQVRGTISVTSPIDLGMQHLGPLLDRFAADNPEVQVRVFYTDEIVDFVRRGADVAIRYGNLHDSSLITRRLGLDRLIICCSPGYAKNHGAPQHPGDLRQHNCLTFLSSEELKDDWPFEEGGRLTSIRVSGSRQTNDGYMLRQWALEGVGLVRKSVWEVASDLESGALIPVLSAFQCEQQGCSC